MITKPSSFATLCTYSCFQELVGFLISLSVHHYNEKIYIICDAKTYDEYNKMSFKPILQITWFCELDEYTNLNRKQMEAKRIWSKFQMYKSVILDYALKIENDCLFLDSDIIITDVIDDIDTTKELGVSPGFVNNDIGKKYGFYNGGMLWVKNKMIPEQWREFTKISRYYDQASIEDLYKYYNESDNVFCFQDNYNLQSWRFICGVETGEQIMSHISVNKEKQKVYYKDKPLKFIHTHFNHKDFEKLNNLFIKIFMEAKMYKELLSIYRCIHIISPFLCLSLSLSLHVCMYVCMSVLVLTL